MARIRVEYDGKIVTIDGWLSGGPATFVIPRGGHIEMFKCSDGSVGLVCRDRNGMSKPMRVEEARSA